MNGITLQAIKQLMISVVRRELTPTITAIDQILDRLDEHDKQIKDIKQLLDGYDTKLDRILNIIGETQEEHAGILAVHSDYLSGHEKRIVKLETRSTSA